MNSRQYIGKVKTFGESFAAIAALFVLTSALAHAVTNETWVGPLGGTWDTGTTANWDIGTTASTWASGNDALFDGGGVEQAVITPGGVSADALNIYTNGTVITLNGGPLTLTSVATGTGGSGSTAGTGAAIELNNTGSLIANSTIILGAASASTQVFSLTGGGLEINGSLTDNGTGVNLSLLPNNSTRFTQINGTTTLAGATGITITNGGGTDAAYYFGGNINLNGGGSLILQDAGSASVGALYVLGGTNTFSGGSGTITLKGGVLEVANSASLPNIYFDGGTSGNNAGTLLVTGTGLTSFSGTTVTYEANGDVGIGVAAGSSFNVNVALAQANGDFDKFDAGNLTISGNNNTYNRFTELNGGTVTLDYSTNNNNKISSGNQLLLGGDNLVLNGGSFAQTVSNTVVRVTAQNGTAATVGGASSITQQNGTSTISLGALTQAIGNTLDVVSPGVASTTTANTNGILAPWATFGSGTSMQYASGGGTITGAGVSATALPSTGGTATSNYSMGSGTTAVTSSELAYTLQYTGTSGGGNLTLGSGQTLTLNGLLNTGTDGLTISGGSGVVIGAAAGPAKNELVLTGPGNTTISTVISGGGALTDSGTGTLTLTGINTYTGNDYFNAGTVAINSNASLGAVGTGASVYLDGATLQEISNTGALTLDNAGSNKRGIVLGPNGGSVSVSGTDALTVDGVVGSYLNNLSGGLTKTGTGTLILSGANTFTGGLNINGGTVQLGNASALGTGASILNAVAFGASSNGVFNLGGNSITIVGLTGDSTATVNNGSTNAALTVNVAGNLASNTFAGALANGSGGALSLVKDGAGTLILSGTNTYTGSTSIIDGSLQLGNGTTDGTLSSSSNIANGGLGGVIYDIIGSQSYGGAISGIGSVSMIGSGTQTLAGTNTYTGATSVSSGTLGLTGSLTGSNISTTGTGNFSESSTGVIGGAGSTLTQGSSGTTTLSGANTYGGATTVNTGTLLVANTGGSATGFGAVNVGGTSSSSHGTLTGGSGAANGGSLLPNGFYTSTPTYANYATGTGAIAGVTTINQYGHLAPGSNGVGTITLAAFTLNSGGNLDYEFNTTAQTNDFTLVSTALTLNGGTLNLYMEGTTNAFAAVGVYDIIGYSGATFNGSIPLTIGDQVAGYQYAFVNDTADSLVQLDITDVATPEPSTWALLAIGLLAMIVRFRRKAQVEL